MRKVKKGTSILNKEVNIVSKVITDFTSKAELYLNIDNKKEPRKAIEYETVEFNHIDF